MSVAGIAAVTTARAARAVFYDDLFRRDFEHQVRQPLEELRGFMSDWITKAPPLATSPRLRAAHRIVEALAWYYGTAERLVHNISRATDGKVTLRRVVKGAKGLAARRGASRAAMIQLKPGAGGTLARGQDGKARGPLSIDATRRVTLSEVGLEAIVVERDRARLTLFVMMLTDILSNAMRHAEPGSSVTVRYDRTSRTLEVANASRHRAPARLLYFANTALLPRASQRLVPLGEGGTTLGVRNIVGVVIRLRLGLHMRVSARKNGTRMWYTRVHFGTQIME